YKGWQFKYCIFTEASHQLRKCQTACKQTKCGNGIICSDQTNTMWIFKLHIFICRAVHWGIVTFFDLLIGTGHSKIMTVNQQFRQRPTDNSTNNQTKGRTCHPERQSPLNTMLNLKNFTPDASSTMSTSQGNRTGNQTNQRINT